MGEGLNKPFFLPKDVYRRSLFLFLALRPLFSHARLARELADVFEKNEKKNKTASVYRLDLIFLRCSNFLFILRSGITLQTTSE